MYFQAAPHRLERILTRTYIGKGVAAASKRADQGS